MKQLVIALLGTTALLAGGCAALPDTEVGHEDEGQAGDLRILERQASVPDDQELMYQLLLGEFAGVRGQLSVALDAYLQAMRLTDDPQPAARATRISIYADQNLKGLEAAGRWVEVDPDDPAARQALGIFHLRNDDMKQALRQFHELVMRSEDPAAAFAHISAGLGQEENSETAVSVLRALAESFAEIPEAHLVYAQTALRMDDAATAVEAAEAGLAVAPASRELATLHAQALIESGQEEAGANAIEALIERYPEDAELRLYLARTLLDTGREDEALGHFRQVLQERPDDAAVLYATGLLTLEAGHPEQAQPYFMRLVELGERTNEAHFLLGQIAEEQGQLEDALHWYERVEGESRLLAKLRRAILLGDLGRLGAARDLLQQVRDQHPGESVRSYLLEGEVLRRNYLNDEAQTLYTEALEQHPGNADLIYARALVAVQEDNLASAERDLRYLVERDPQNAQALNALGYTLVDAVGRLQEGFELIQRAYGMQPENPAILDSMGWAYYRLGDPEKALSYLRRAHELMPDAEVSAHLGEVLWAIGNREDARRVWNKALEREPEDPVLNETIQRLDP